MRRKFNHQLNLFMTMARNKIAKELEQISLVLDATPQVVELTYQDLERRARPTTGREGMTAEQVLRCAILKQYRQLTYEELAFHLEDSDSFRSFSRLEMGQHPSKSILQENIKALWEETWEAIHREIIGYAKAEKIETSRKVRIDATAVETDIHYPTDSTLLADGIRIIIRWLAEGKGLTQTPRSRSRPWPRQSRQDAFPGAPVIFHDKIACCCTIHSKGKITPKLYPKSGFYWPIDSSKCHFSPIKIPNNYFVPAFFSTFLIRNNR